jgi:phosphate transport system substrate-binding protein
MSTPATGAEFLELVVQSGLLTRDQTEPYAGSELAAEPDAPRLLAERLIGDGLLTSFQTRQLLAGKVRGYFFAENKYKALVPLGNGVLGPCILCEDTRLRQQVAIYLLQKAPEKDAPKAAAVERFVREALSVGTMNHPNLVRVFGLEWSGKTPFLILEHAEGTPLRQLVADSGPPAIQQAAQWVRQAATGLQHAHAKRLIHREVSPANLILDANGTVRVTGFGLTHLFRTPNPGGTDPNDALLAALADFMSPEQAAGASGDARADVYGLGATLYFLLTGRVPFDSANLSDKVTGHQSRQPPPVRELRPDVTYGLAEVLGHMMAKNPNERYQTMADVSVALSQWARDPSTKAVKAVKAGPAPVPRREPTFPPLGTVSTGSTGSGGSWNALPAPPAAPGAARGNAPRPTAAPGSVPAPNFGTNGDTPHETRAAARPTAGGRTAPPAVPPADDPEEVEIAPPLPPPPQTRTRILPVLPPAASPVTARAQAPPDRPAAPQPKKRKPVSALALGLSFLILALIVGGGIAVVVISGSPTAPTLPKTPVATKPKENEANSTKPPESGTGPKPPDATKVPDKKADTTPPPVAASSTLLKGSGSTFIKPAMEYWTKLYEEKTGVRIEYVGNGSGSGIANMTDKVTDFGCTDAFMTDAQLKKAKANVGEVLHIPLAMGAVVVTYNLEVKKQLTFRGEVLAQIYLGEITKWNHPAILQSNPGVDLPDTTITVIHRGDASGTTAIWTEYLTKVNPDWEKLVGTGTTVKWPVGEDAEKNDGVAKAVSKTVGAIGYVELSFALERNLKYAQIKNSQNKAIQPTLESVTTAAVAALADIKPDSDLRYSLTNPPGEDSYPIVGTTWMVLYMDQTAAKKKGKELVGFLRWAMDEGQPKLKDLRYAPLPPKLAALVKEKIGKILTSD